MVHGLYFFHLFTVVEVESALRHKAKLERHQRTAERAVYSNALLSPLLVLCSVVSGNSHHYQLSG
jgi:hypothetical protein